MIRSIEGLRGVAALMVVFFHAFILARWGGAPAQWGIVQNAWLFVDLFFVISGVIMAAVYGERLRNGAQLRGFFIKRFFRLYPLHLVTTFSAIHFMEDNLYQKTPYTLNLFHKALLME